MTTVDLSAPDVQASVDATWDHALSVLHDYIAIPAKSPAFERVEKFISRKLYREFVYATPDESYVADLAQGLVDDNFEIAPTLRRLFKKPGWLS